MPPSKTFDRFFLFTSFANYPLSFKSTTTAKKNIRQLNAHRCRHPLSQLSSAVFYVTSPVKLSLLTRLWRGEREKRKSLLPSPLFPFPFLAIFSPNSEPVHGLVKLIGNLAPRFLC